MSRNIILLIYITVASSKTITYYLLYIYFQSFVRSSNDAELGENVMVSCTELYREHSYYQNLVDGVDHQSSRCPYLHILK
jgi:hypothetical protein